jgi:(S)-2-hydroxyglutarate dehydrogenase
VQDHYDIAIIGGGIMGACMAFFIAMKACKVILIEREKKIAFHSSSRNTGKVHAPFLYDPIKKKSISKAAFLGFDMLKKYCFSRSLPFKEDGIILAATYDNAIDKLYKYMEWGYSNGLRDYELKLLSKEELSKTEPNIRCLSALYCSRDASTDYRAITEQLIEDAKLMGCKVILASKLKRISSSNDHLILHTESGYVFADFIINAAGGSSLHIAHKTNVATQYSDLHFRGEYWQAPAEYNDLTKISVYSVPKYPEFPFLDPHWIIRTDGRREIGPNAVPVFGPYAYSWSINIRNFLPKIIETSFSGARKTFTDTQFLSLARNELISSFSKRAMINRVREFLPQLNVNKFIRRATSGIRSCLVDSEGKFISDILIAKTDRSLHILNNNSPGATGSLPLAAKIVNRLIEEGHLRCSADQTNRSVLWDIKKIAEEIP